MSRRLIETLAAMENYARLREDRRGGIKGLSAFLRRHRESAEWAEAQRYRAHPKAAPRIEVRPGGYLVDAREEEIETQRWEAHRRSLEARRQAAIAERADDAAARRQYDQARREQAQRETPPGFPAP